MITDILWRDTHAWIQKLKTSISKAVHIYNTLTPALPSLPGFPVSPFSP